MTTINHNYNNVRMLVNKSNLWLLAYTAWTNDGTCSVTCGDGLIRQTRICIRGTCDPQDLTRFMACNNGACNGKLNYCLKPSILDNFQKR